MGSEYAEAPATQMTASKATDRAIPLISRLLSEPLSTSDTYTARGRGSKQTATQGKEQELVAATIVGALSLSCQFIIARTFGQYCSKDKRSLCGRK